MGLFDSKTLEYNLENYKAERDNIEALKDRISDRKTAMEQGLETLRTDWDMPGGVAFFESIDGEWAVTVENCITIVEDLVTALDDAYKKYEAIEEGSKKYLKM